MNNSNSTYHNRKEKKRKSPIFELFYLATIYPFQKYFFCDSISDPLGTCPMINTFNRKIQLICNLSILRSLRLRKFSSNRVAFRRKISAKLFGFCLFLCVSFYPLIAQNLVPNGDFEEYDQCPTAPDQFNGFVKNWSIPFGVNTYFNDCGYTNPTKFSSRNNSAGNTYMSTYRKNTNSRPRTYLRNQLTRPLQPGERVYISYWIYNWGALGRSFFTEDFSIYFSDTLVTKKLEEGKQWIELPAQFNWTGGVIRKTGEYVPITGCYEAEGEEKFICLGNFKHPDSMTLDSIHRRPEGNALALDDVKIISEDDIDFSNTSQCPGQTYKWQDPYDMNFQVQSLTTGEVIDSFIMPNSQVKLEVFLPGCRAVDTIEISPKPCKDCYSVVNDIVLCITDSISLDTLLADSTEILIGNTVYKTEDVFRPIKDTSYFGVLRSAYCDTIALVAIDIEACASCSPTFENLSLCPGERFDLSPYAPFEVKMNGASVSNDTIVRESGVYSIVLSSSGCDTVAVFDLKIDDCHNCIRDLERERMEICINENLPMASFLRDSMYIENDLSSICPGEYLVNVRHETCKTWKDSILLEVRGDRECYRYRIRDTICEGEPIVVENDTSLNLELGFQARFSSGYRQDLVLKDNRCPQIAFEEQVIIFDCKECTYAIPNLFTPNGDGVNDFFSISVNCSVMDFEAEIYDRWGALMYRSKDPNRIWNGSDASMGTYVYRIRMSLFNGRELETILETGAITLVR